MSDLDVVKSGNSTVGCIAGSGLDDRVKEKSLWNNGLFLATSNIMMLLVLFDKLQKLDWKQSSKSIEIGD